MRLHLYSYALMDRSSLVRTHCVFSGHSQGFFTKLSICRVKGLQIAQPHTVLLEQISVLFSGADRAIREKSFRKILACSEIWMLLSSRTAISTALHNCTNRAIVLHRCSPSLASGVFPRTLLLRVPLCLLLLGRTWPNYHL